MTTEVTRMRLDELTERRLDRRSVLRTFAIGGAGVAAAAILGCSSDDDGEDDAMMEESMTATPTEEAMAEGSMTPTGTAMSDDGMMEVHDHDVGAERIGGSPVVLGGGFQALVACGGNEVAPALRHRRRTGDVEGAVVGVDDDVVDIGFKQPGGDLAGCLDHLAGSLEHGGPSELQRP